MEVCCINGRKGRREAGLFLPLCGYCYRQQASQEDKQEISHVCKAFKREGKIGINPLFSISCRFLKKLARYLV
jgi:hypothetical protein